MVMISDLNITSHPVNCKQTTVLNKIFVRTLCTSGSIMKTKFFRVCGLTVVKCLVTGPHP